MVSGLQSLALRHGAPRSRQRVACRESVAGLRGLANIAIAKHLYHYGMLVAKGSWGWRGSCAGFKTPNKKRQTKDAKFGFGGRKALKKQNDAFSAADMDGYKPGKFKVGRQLGHGGESPWRGVRACK